MLPVPNLSVVKTIFGEPTGVGNGVGVRVAVGVGVGVEAEQVMRNICGKFDEFLPVMLFCELNTIREPSPFNEPKLPEFGEGEFVSLVKL
jgi:hypothetical protein